MSVLARSLAQCEQVDFVLCDITAQGETCRGTPEQRKQRNFFLVLVLAFKVLPYPLLHWFEYRALSWKVAGTSRDTLQSNLLRKFLQDQAIETFCLAPDPESAPTIPHELRS